MGNSEVKECSIFPNGHIIKNDRLVEIIEVVYDLLLSHDGQTVLYLLLFKVRFGKLSPKFPRYRKVKDYRQYMKSELGFLTSKGNIPKDVKITLLYLDEMNNLTEKLHFKLLEGRRFSYRMILTLDQYDPELKKVFPSKHSWKAKTDEDFRKGLGEKNWKFLHEVGGADEIDT